MEIFNTLLAPALAPYLAALAVVLVVFVLEVLLTVLMGLGCSDLVEALVSTDSLPDSSFLNWLLVREVPLLITILAFLTGFGAFGLALQGLSAHFFDATVPGTISIALSLLFGVVCIRYLTLAVTKLGLVGTTALPPAEFIGQVAMLTSTCTYKGYAGEACFTDRHGYTHYVMVEPLEPSDTFAQGEKMVIVSQASLALYHVRKP